MLPSELFVPLTHTSFHSETTSSLPRTLPFELSLSNSKIIAFSSKDFLQFNDLGSVKMPSVRCRNVRLFSGGPVETTATISCLEWLNWRSWPSSSTRKACHWSRKKTSSWRTPPFMYLPSIVLFVDSAPASSFSIVIFSSFFSLISSELISHFLIHWISYCPIKRFLFFSFSHQKPNPLAIFLRISTSQV